MVPTGWTTCPKKPFSGMGNGCSWLGSIPIFVNAFQKRMSAKLSLSIRILYVV